MRDESRIVKIDAVDQVASKSDGEEVTARVHRVDALAAGDGGYQALPWRKSQYLTVLSQEPVARMGALAARVSTKHTLRTVVLWASHTVVWPEVISTTWTFASAPTPATRAPSLLKSQSKSGASTDIQGTPPMLPVLEIS